MKKNVIKILFGVVAVTALATGCRTNSPSQTLRNYAAVLYCPPILVATCAGDEAYDSNPKDGQALVGIQLDTAKAQTKLNLLAAGFPADRAEINSTALVALLNKKDATNDDVNALLETTGGVSLNDIIAQENDSQKEAANIQAMATLNRMSPEAMRQFINPIISRSVGQ